MKRKICLLLAMLMILSTSVALSSCKDDEQNGDSTTVTTLPSSGDDDPDAKLYEDLPTGNYGGYEFKSLNVGYALNPIGATDTLSVAMFERASIVKEKLGIEITDSGSTYSAIKTTMSSLTASGDFEYDIVFNETYYQTPLAQTGTYFSVDDYTDSINLDKPWWFTDAMDSIAIDGNSYELYGDLQPMYFDMIWALSFNQDDFTNNKVPFPYDTVRAGKWTIDEMERIIKITAATIGDEHYGVTSHKDFAHVMVAASDFVLVSQDDDYILKVFDNEDRLVEIYNKIRNAFFASNGDYKQNWIKPPVGSASFTRESHQTTTFREARATFMGGVIGDIRSVRDAEFDYGILPFPKYEEGQETYVSHISRVAPSGGLPATNPDIDRACVILENLCAYSYKHVKDEYYDVVVQGRTVRDADSMEMLDITFGYSDKGKAIFEIDAMYTLGIGDSIRQSMCDNSTEVMVGIGSAMPTIVANVETIIEAYK